MPEVAFSAETKLEKDSESDWISDSTKMKCMLHASWNQVWVRHLHSELLSLR